MDNDIKIIHTMGQNNCGGRCIIDVHVCDGKVVKISTDTNKGSLKYPPLTACAKGLNYHKTYLDEQKRLKKPLLRVGERGSGAFREISWEEAVNFLSGEWTRIRDLYGAASRYVHYGWGVSAMVSPMGLAKRLLALDGGFLDYYNSYSNACINYVTPYIYGNVEAGNSFSQLCSSKMIILWGHNPADTRFDAMMYYLLEAKKRNIPIICIDPRYHNTAKALKAEWIALKPATDAALMDAMAYVMITEQLYDAYFIRTYCQGFTADTMPKGYETQEDYFSYVLGKRDCCPKTPQWAEAITGVPKEKIYELARRYAGTKPAALIQGYGPQRNANGEQTVFGSIMLACLTGNVGISGGWSGSNCTTQNPPVPVMPSVKNPVSEKIPVYAWTEAVEKGRIKMILNLAGNALLNQHGDINKTKQILKDTSKCELIVTSDVFMTPSAGFSDLVLPAASFLETDNITFPWVSGEFIGFNNKVTEPIGESRFEYDWLKEVADKLGLYEEFTEGHETSEEWQRDCYEKLRTKMLLKEAKEEAKEKTRKQLQKQAEGQGVYESKNFTEELPPYEEAKKAGIYRYKNWPEQIAFRKQREDFANNPFHTPSGKIEIFCPGLFEQGRNLENAEHISENGKERPVILGRPGYIRAKEGPESEICMKYPIQLIGYHTKRRCHSIHETNKVLEKLDPQAVHIHTKDADARNIADGDLVYVYNDRGCIKLPAKVTDGIMEGVAAIPQGAWYTPNEQGIDIRGNINVLTDLECTPLAKGNGQHTNLVQIQLA